MDTLAEPDPYCPVMRGDDRTLAIRLAPQRDLAKLERACTTIVMARG